MRRCCHFSVVLFFALLQAQAQQNFFNVPSSELTEKKKFFIQQQLNLLPSNVSTNITVCYGLGHKFEVGINLLGITYDYASQKLVSSAKFEQPIYPTLGGNLQKQLLVINAYQLTLGTQILFLRNFYACEYYSYLNNKIQLKRIKAVAGLYYGNDNYLGKETRFSNNIYPFGIQLGFEYEVVKDILFFQSDFISGNTPVSNLIIGGAYKLNKRLIFSSGFQIPNNKNTFSSGIIVELTFLQ